jgi:hypothetical protein
LWEKIYEEGTQTEDKQTDKGNSKNKVVKIIAPPIQSAPGHE